MGTAALMPGRGRGEESAEAAAHGATPSDCAGALGHLHPQHLCGRGSSWASPGQAPPAGNGAYPWGSHPLHLFLMHSSNGGSTAAPIQCEVTVGAPQASSEYCSEGWKKQDQADEQKPQIDAQRQQHSSAIPSWHPGLANSASLQLACGKPASAVLTAWPHLSQKTGCSFTTFPIRFVITGYHDSP